MKTQFSEKTVEPHGQEPVAPAVRRNPPKLQSSFAKASEDTRIHPRAGARGTLRRRVEGSRMGKIILAQHSEISDPETGGSYTIKKYQSTKVANQEHEWEHTKIQLMPINPSFKPIEITPSGAEEIKVIAEFVVTLEKM